VTEGRRRSGRPDRRYIIDDGVEVLQGPAGPAIIGELDRNAVLRALEDVEAIGHREGGAFVITPIRMKINLEGDPYGRDELYVTTGWSITHTYAPNVELTTAVGQYTEDELLEAAAAEAEAGAEPAQEPAE
jgi:hypothetical protein